MPTNREMVSKVRNLLKLNNVDVFISDRFILSVLSGVNTKLVTQQLQKRSYWNSPNLFTNIDCLVMEPVPLYTCCSTTSNCDIARSVLPLPAIVDCMFGLVIRGVWSIDEKNQFKELDSPSRLVNLMNIYPKKSFNRYYFIHESHLYVTDPNIELVKMSAFFKDIIDMSKYSCNKDVDNPCPTNPLDQKFSTLPKLEDDIVTISAQKLMESFLQIPQDATADNRERT